MMLGVLLALPLVVAGRSSECTADEKKVYHLSALGAQLTWIRAEAECESLGMTLATVKTNAELAMLKKLIAGIGPRLHDEYYHLGASCSGNCGSLKKDGWYWITDLSKVQSPFLMDNWYSPDSLNRIDYVNQPDFERENQYVMDMIKYPDVKWCDGEHNYVCPWVCQECVSDSSNSAERSSCPVCPTASPSDNSDYESYYVDEVIKVYDA